MTTTRSGTDAEHARFTVLFDQHHVAVSRYAGRRVDADAVADVVSDVFLVAWRRRDELPSNPLPWLYGVARRVIANHRRGAERRTDLVARLTQFAARDRGDDDSDPTRLATAFAALSESDREVLGLVAWEELSIAGVAAATGCSVPAATMRLHRAKRRLREALTDATEREHGS